MKKTMYLLLVVLLCFYSACKNDTAPKTPEETIKDWVQSHDNEFPIRVTQVWKDAFAESFEFRLISYTGSILTIRTTWRLPSIINKTDFWNPEQEIPDQTVKELIYSMDTRNSVFDSLKKVHITWKKEQIKLEQERKKQIEKETAELAQTMKETTVTTITTESSSSSSGERRDGFGSEIHTQPNGEDKVWDGANWVDPN